LLCLRNLKIRWRASFRPFSAMNSFDTSESSGQIQLIIGPMFSGKTTELLRRVRRHTIARRKCIVIKYEADKRYSAECAATHDKNTHAAISVSTLSSVTARGVDLSAVDVIGIDEGQFYPDLIDFCELWANQGKVIIVSALDATFQRKPFGAIAELIPLAERVDKLTAVCMCCSNAASFTARLGSETAVELIGGTDLYISMCRKCFRMPSSRQAQLHASNRSESSSSPVHSPSTPPAACDESIGSLSPSSSGSNSDNSDSESPR
jgi:thymidine kinase